MSTCRPRTTHLNPHREIYPHLTSEEQGKTIQDLFRFYYPKGPIRKSVAFFGAAGISQVLSINNTLYSTEHMIQQMLGMSGLQTGLDESIVAGGKGQQIPNSVLGAMGESVERFAGTLKALADETEIVYGSYRELTAGGKNCIHPEELPLFAEQQYNKPNFIFEPFDEQARVGWMEGERLISGQSIWVPAQLASFFYFSVPGERNIAYSSSAGMACHVNRSRAIFGGIKELFERDAMMTSWYSGIPPRRIEIDRPLRHPDQNRMSRMLHSLPGGISCYLHDMAEPELMVVSVMGIDEHLKKFSYYAGGGADVDADEAVADALVEFGQSEAQMKLATIAPDRVWSAGAALYFDVPPDKAPEEMMTFLENLGYYGWPENRERLEWYFNQAEDAETVKLSELPTFEFESSEEKLAFTLDVLKKHDFDPIYLDYTPPQMQQLHVCKIIMPGLLQPHVTANPYLGHPRIYNLPYELGLVDEPLSYEDLNPGPVPFP
jgi:ribosomal protein S12 methylthiotransferase accessory factor